MNTDCNVIDPDHVGAIKSDRITAPDVVRVQFGNLDVLDDDVAGTRNDTQTLALNHTAAALSDDGLLRSNSDAKDACIVVADTGRRSTGLVVLAPVILVDCKLAGRASSPGSTTSTRSSTLSAGEVEGLLQDDDTGRGVAQVRD